MASSWKSSSSKGKIVWRSKEEGTVGMDSKLK
jgi:hypothetical protein